MLFLQPHHIIDLYCLVDDIVPTIEKPQGGRPTLLSSSELITLLVWNTLVLKQQTLKDLHGWIQLYHTADFPHLPHYSAFVDHCHRVIPLLVLLLQHLLHYHAHVRFLDSTMLPVCTNERASRHRVARSVAAWGKNHQGWHYGFKLHLAIDHIGKLCGLIFTPADVYDAQMIPHIVNTYTKVAVGDSHYGARVMRQKVFTLFGTLVITPPHWKQTRKLMTQWQHTLLSWRPKIESVFDYLKEHLHLVSSFPRSIAGYFLHYLRILTGYQLMHG